MPDISDFAPSDDTDSTSQSPLRPARRRINVQTAELGRARAEARAQAGAPSEWPRLLGLPPGSARPALDGFGLCKASVWCGLMYHCTQTPDRV